VDMEAHVTKDAGGMAETLTNKQAAFVREYLVDFNATQAAIRAGYSPKTARSQGARLLTNVDVNAAIQAEIMSGEEAMIGITDIARGNMADLMDITPSGFILKLTTKDGGINPSTKLIKKIKQKVTTFLAKNESDEDREIIETEIELYSSHEAFRDIAKFHKLFVNQNDITSDGKQINVYLKSEND